jgi:hypothetical protein
MNTPLQTHPSKYYLAAALLVGFVATAFVISCSTVKDGVGLGPGEGPATYIVTFGDDPANPSHRVFVDIKALEKALSSPGPNWSTLQKLSPGQTEQKVITGPQIPAPPSTVTIAQITVNSQITSSAQPCSLHVTQRVGLNNLHQFVKVLSAIRPPP